MSKRRNPQSVVILTADDEEVASGNPLPVVAGTGDNAIGRVKITDGTDVADVLDLATFNPLAVAILDGTGAQITSFGGGTQYTEGDTDASITGTAVMWEDAGNTLVVASAAKPLPVAATVDPTGLATSANQTTMITSLATIAGDTTDIEAAVELIDDTVVVLGTTAYTETTSKGLAVGAVRRDADTTLVDTTNEWGPLQMDANGALKVEIFDGGGSHTVDNNGTFVTQVDGAALTALQLIDDIVYVDDTATHATGTSKGALIMGAAVPTDTSVSANDIGAIGMTTDRRMYVEATVAAAQTLATVTTVGTVSSVTAIAGALPAGTNAIGKLAANSGVDIGDVDVTSIAAGTNNIGNVGIIPRTSGGATTFMASGSDGSSILVATKQTIKNSAGQLYGYYAYNPEAAASFVHFYNTDTVTVGTTNPQMTIAIPAGSAANLALDFGIAFSTAISCAATTTAGGNTAPATGVSLVAWYA